MVWDERGVESKEIGNDFPVDKKLTYNSPPSWTLLNASPILTSFILSLPFLPPAGNAVLRRAVGEVLGPKKFRNT